MTIEYKYRIWRNVFMLCQPYVWYSIDPNRNDHNDFVVALKEFHQQWGLLQFSNDFTMYMKIDPLVYMNEIISADQRHTDLTDSKAEASRYGDFYTQAYEPGEMERKSEVSKSAEPVIVPGVCSSTGQHWNGQIDYSSSQQPESSPQSDDLPFDGTPVPPRQETLFSGPKNDSNIFAQKLEQLKKEKEDDCEF